MAVMKAWMEWVYAILANGDVARCWQGRNETILSGIARAVLDVQHKFKYANFPDDELVLLVPEVGWHPAGDYFPTTLYGIKTLAVHGLTWPVVGVELTRDK
jgi:hypothetical protein